ncbi:TadE/TadG family type IV pilus assembly protein [Desulfosporosinus sp.]|uniref:TadE/TadG family type IV pilus assembly protein n=1 Tax=Desulfosporosinus sp. TaxID=157907 RepID=UPI000E9E4568|nr:TadE/TadG family type IV pilus assembly protein [Desulfosporosinus sp.]MBC2723293.1 pilus assembly protein [Desulfosporosinus sp.]MBC2725774.1 pilus assembly protein [Desulfosporosinus sp.]HBV86973.1 pilus assembly protein TadE [Desulfosporosinus sp.]
MIRKLYKGERGQAMVEMALVLPLLFLLLFGVIEMGRIGYSYITVSNAARAGVRVATVGATDSEITSSVIGAAPSLNSASLSISITPIESLRLSGQGVTVQVSYPVQLVIPIISNVLPNPVVVSAATVMRIE